VTIFAAGYPEKHHDAESINSDIDNLSAKVQAGVDGILTQVVFSASKFCEFVVKCRERGISTDVPIIPGIYIPYTFDELNRILIITKATIPDEMYEKLKSMRDNDQLFQEESLKFIKELIENIKRTSAEFICGFHFFTMNNFYMLNSLVNDETFTAL
jgi:methylenetetrahydrofolate reductase (NADPH)